MKTCLFIFVLFLISQTCFGQEATGKDKKWTESEQKQLEKAELFFNEKNYKLALFIYQRLLSNHPDDIKLKYSVAVCGYSYPGLQKLSLNYLEEVYVKNKKAHEIEFNLAKAYYYNERFDDALKQANGYLLKNANAKEEVKKDVNDFIAQCTAAKLLAEKPVNVTIENFGAIINSNGAESAPCLSEDENRMIFTYRGDKSTGGLQNPFNQPDKNGVYFEDVYETMRIDGKWQQPMPLQNVNGKNNEAALFLSPEAKQLFISIDSPQDDGDIYMCKYDTGVWSAPIRVSGAVNSPSWEDNCSLSPDGQTLFFSSNRAGGFGGKDIYWASLMPDGTWGNVKNLGDKINTPQDDDAPFLHFDGRLFLFSSKGHGGMGGYDVFRSQFNPADSTWSVPENLGYPINTPMDENHYSLSMNGEHGYYGIGKSDGFGDLDIYSVNPGIVGAKPAVLVIKGRVTLDEANALSDIIVEVPAKNKVVRLLKTNSSDGTYNFTLPLGEDYKITYKTDKQEPKSETILANGVQEYLLKVVDIRFNTPKDTSLAVHTTTQSIAVVGVRDSVTNQVIYKIQVSAQSINKKLRKRIEEQFYPVEELVYEGEKKYILKKEMTTLNQAIEELEKVRKIVPDAFVLGFYEGKRYHLYQLREKGLLPPKIKKQLLP